MKRGTSVAYGARELKRTIHKHLIQPIAAMVAEGEIDPGSRVTSQRKENGDGLEFTIRDTRLRAISRDDFR